MDASRLTISPEKLRFERISPSRKVQLRRQNVIDLVNSKPYGYVLRPAEVASVTALTTGGAYALLVSMVKRGTLAKHDVSPRRAFYTVNSEVRVVKPAAPVPAKEPAPQPTALPSSTAHGTAQAAAEEEPVSTNPPELSHAQLLRLSKDFAWENNSDSLREFVAWVANRG